MRPTSSFRPVQRVERDVGRPLDADEDGAIGRGADLARQRRADVGLAIGDRRYRRHVVEAPEAIVDAVDEHLAGAPPALLIGDEALHHDERRHRPEPAREIRMGADRLGQRLAEEVRRHDDVVGVAEPLQHEVAQARPHRVADEQRAGEHGDRRGDAGDDGQVRPPVVAEAAGDERPGLTGYLTAARSGCVLASAPTTDGTEATPRTTQP